MGPIQTTFLKMRVVNSLVERGWDRREARQQVQVMNGKSFRWAAMQLNPPEAIVKTMDDDTPSRPGFQKLVDWFIANWEEIMRIILGAFFGIVI